MNSPVTIAELAPLVRKLLAGLSERLRRKELDVLSGEWQYAATSHTRRRHVWGGSISIEPLGADRKRTWRVMGKREWEQLRVRNGKLVLDSPSCCWEACQILCQSGRIAFDYAIDLPGGVLHGYVMGRVTQCDQRGRATKIEARLFHLPNLESSLLVMVRAR